MSPLRVLITAGRGEGKTTFIKEISRHLETRLVPHTGFYAEGAWEDGSRKSFCLTLLPGKDIVPLCDRTTEEWLKFGRFRYNPAALARGNETIAGARPGEIIIMDEIGRQELEGRVWADALGVALSKGNPLILSVQLRYLEDIISRLKLREYTVYNVGIDPWHALFKEVTSLPFTG